MADKIASVTLNATTRDIINTIRANASTEYQNNVPELLNDEGLTGVGNAILGNPSFKNQFIESLVNRIALVVINSASFNNKFANLKKGMITLGETVEELFVQLLEARVYTPEKADAQEFKRTIPKIKAAFHKINWRVQYPVTIQEKDLRMAFTSMSGVQSLVTKIIDAVFTAVEYDEYLLFKYVLIKAISHGKTTLVPINGTLTGANKDPNGWATAFRGYSNMIEFPSNKYNYQHVLTSTPKDRQCIFMDAMFNANYDVNVLASAFNMDKATFSGKLKMLDNFDSFDNARLKQIVDESDMIEEVTAEELAICKNVRAVLVDEDWFQFYDNLREMTSTVVQSGMYWNYFYNVWMIVSTSPFSNIITFYDNTDERGGVAPITPPDKIRVTITSKLKEQNAVTFTGEAHAFKSEQNVDYKTQGIEFVQTEELTTAGIAVQPYGQVIIPTDQLDTTITMKCVCNGIEYTATSTFTGRAGDVGSSLELTPSLEAKATNEVKTNKPKQ